MPATISTCAWRKKPKKPGWPLGVHSSNISVVDFARQPAKPVAPDLPLYLAITFFAGLWIAVGAALLRESLASFRDSFYAVVLPCVAQYAAGVSTRRLPRPTPQACPAGGQRFRRRRITGARRIPRKLLRSGTAR
jgi:hypothetical protein